jgi:hypothetical protein
VTASRERLPRALRNAVADLIVAALDDDRAAAALRELRTALTASAAESAGGDVAAAVRRELASASAAARTTVAERLARASAAVTAYRGARGTSRGDDTAQALRQAAALFDAGLYFEVHEVLEVAWGRARGPTRTFLQGVLQIAVALHHAEYGNDGGAARLLAAGRAKVAPHAPTFHGVDVAGLLADVGEWERRRAAGHGAPPAPRLVVRLPY